MRTRIRRAATVVLVVLFLLAVVNQLRGDNNAKVAETPPIATTPTTAYVPAAVRGDPIPVVVAPSGISVSRGGSTWRGLSLSAPGAKPDDVIGVFLAAPAASLSLRPPDGLKLYPSSFPSFLAFEGHLDVVNAALAAVHYTPTSTGPKEVTINMTNTTLHTNPRSATVTVQVT